MCRKLYVVTVRRLSGRVVLQYPDGGSTHLLQRLVHRRQRRRVPGRDVGVIEADDAEVLGTDSPCPRAASITPKADGSQAATMADGGFGRASSRVAPVNPLS